MKLYIIENYKDMYGDLKGSELTDALIFYCLEDYRQGFRFEIFRTERGKPYLKGSEKLFLSVSHSENTFACIFSDTEVGLDIQYERGVAAQKITRRYFTAEEQLYIGEDMNKFFRIWTRKEAYAKYMGNGLEAVINGTDVLNRDDVVFTEFMHEDLIHIAFCTKTGKDGTYEIQVFD
ncbi:MAG: 4'-phosphopantetheinyl transferase family protein [Lentihominibacter sp.]|jgi:phosphopantetheinyl transferase